MEQIVSRENMMTAYRRVMANKGAPGIDKMTVEQLKPYLTEHWPRIKEELLTDRYQPAAVRGVEIPKPGGKGMRLIRRYLLAGLMMGGMVTARSEGTPQGGPLSPTLSNILLDDLDKELERRGHSFCRYADDCNIYMQSRRAGERVMASVTRFLTERLRLTVNAGKSAVDRPWNRSFLGYSMTHHMKPRLKVAAKSVDRLRDKLRTTFRQGRGRSIGRTVETLTPILRGWINYFRLAQVKGAFEELDGWLRRKPRCSLWRQWKRPWTRQQKMMARGLDERRAWHPANNGRGPWWNAAASHMNDAYRKSYFDTLGLLSFTARSRKAAWRPISYLPIRAAANLNSAGQIANPAEPIGTNITFWQPFNGNYNYPPTSTPGIGINDQEEQTKAVYAMARFARHDLFGLDVPWDGNLGIRAVRTDTVSRGVGSIVSIPLSGDASSYSASAEEALQFANGATTETRYTNHYTDLLPSLNLRFMPRDDTAVGPHASHGAAGQPGGKDRAVPPSAASPSSPIRPCFRNSTGWR